ncbi:MAG: glucokinase [Vicinamibacterales bacterium]
MLIAGDVGGTNTRLGLFARDAARPRSVLTREYESQRYATFEEILSAFVADLGGVSVDAAAIGVAGPILQQTARLTNIDWEVSASGISAQLGGSKVILLNDLEAMAWSIPVLSATELHVLQAGVPQRGGNAAVVAAGTGLGEAFLPRIDGRFRVLSSEAGHTDFAARTEREMALVAHLTERFGRASLEHVVSGPGLLNLHLFTHQLRPACEAVPDPAAPGAAAQITGAALDGRCPHCGEALAMFAEALGAEAGNLGLRGTATAGVYIGGGIAPRVLPALHTDAFGRAFLDKAPMDDLMARMPLYVILNSDAGLLGAAVAANAIAP